MVFGTFSRRYCSLYGYLCFFLVNVNLLVMQLLRNRLVTTARKSIRKNASLGQLYGNMQEAYHQMQTPLVYQQPPATVRVLLMRVLGFMSYEIAILVFCKCNKIIVKISSRT
jgi:hypothetical protein